MARAPLARSGRGRALAGMAASLALCAALSAGAANHALAADPVAATAPAAAFTRADWQADYAFLKAQLEQQYANLAWFASPQGGVALPELDQRTARALAQAADAIEARAAILAFVAAFHDGHLKSLDDLPPARADAVAEPSRPVLDKLTMAAACAAIGADPSGSVAFSMPFESLDGMQLQVDGTSAPFRMGVVTTAAGTRIGVLRLQRFREKEFAALCGTAWGELRAANKKITDGALQEAIADDWREALAARLAWLKGQHVQAVLLDVGGNGGGNDSGDWSTRMFAARPMRSARLLMTAAPLVDGYLDEQLGSLRRAQRMPAEASADLRAGVERAIAALEKTKAAGAARGCAMAWVWRERRPWNVGACSNLVDVGFASGATDYLAPQATPQLADFASYYYWPAVTDAYRGAWTGPVYVLTDAKVFSSAELFTATMRDNGVARTIGAATGGAGCGNMQKQKLVVLPHSGMRFQAPDCVRLRADGSDEVAGIAPDLPILRAAGESERARALRLLMAIERDLATPSAPK
jgi:hypothetical protein